MHASRSTQSNVSQKETKKSLSKQFAYFSMKSKQWIADFRIADFRIADFRIADFRIADFRIADFRIADFDFGNFGAPRK
jgi:uncharacterized protein YjbI with pentapeptide repeats